MADLKYGELTEKVIGACFRVHGELGFVHKERVYQKALAIELKNSGLRFEKEKGIDILYKGSKVGSYRPDFIIEDKVVLELKAVDFLPMAIEDQMYYYLKGTDYGVGLLII